MSAASNYARRPTRHARLMWPESAITTRAKSGITAGSAAFVTGSSSSLRGPGQEETLMKLRIALDELLPATSAARELPQALDRLERGEVEQFVITKRNEPRAALVSSRQVPRAPRDRGRAPRERQQRPQWQRARRQVAALGRRRAGHGVLPLPREGDERGAEACVRPAASTNQPPEEPQERQRRPPPSTHQPAPAPRPGSQASGARSGRRSR